MYFDFGTFWTSVRDFFNSTFFTAIAGSFAGAVGGAYAAQRIVARNKERDELLTEIRNTSAATVVAFDVCNLFVTIKQQHVKPLKDAFERQKAELHSFRTKRHLGQIPPDTAFSFSADLRSLFLSPNDADYADWFTLFEKKGQTSGRQNSTSQRVKNAFGWITRPVIKKFHRQP